LGGGQISSHKGKVAKTEKPERTARSQALRKITKENHLKCRGAQEDEKRGLRSKGPASIYSVEGAENSRCLKRAGGVERRARASNMFEREVTDVESHPPLGGLPFSSGGS